jgi:hypothetical protein
MWCSDNGGQSRWSLACCVHIVAPSRHSHMPFFLHLSSGIDVVFMQNGLLVRRKLYAKTLLLRNLAKYAKFCKTCLAGSHSQIGRALPPSVLQNRSGRFPTPKSVGRCRPLFCKTVQRGSASKSAGHSRLLFCKTAQGGSTPKSVGAAAFFPQLKSWSPFITAINALVY